MPSTPDGARKMVKTLTEKDPDYFRKLSAKTKNRFGGKRGSFAKGNKHSIKGGKMQRRTSGKILREQDLKNIDDIEMFDLTFEET